MASKLAMLSRFRATYQLTIIRGAAELRPRLSSQGLSELLPMLNEKDKTPSLVQTLTLQ